MIGKFAAAAVVTTAALFASAGNASAQYCQPGFGLGGYGPGVYGGFRPSFGPAVRFSGYYRAVPFGGYARPGFVNPYAFGRASFYPGLYGRGFGLGGFAPRPAFGFGGFRSFGDYRDALEDYYDDLEDYYDDLYDD